MMIDLIKRLRDLEIDHQPDGWPAIRMRDISALLDMVEVDCRKCVHLNENGNFESECFECSHFYAGRFEAKGEQ